MFKKSKYSKWYYSIVDSAKNRKLTGYTEKHHILPKCMGGNDDEANVVTLTAREHFICHWLLSKMGLTKKTQYQLWNAFTCMLYRQNDHQQRYKITSRIFENIKKTGSKIKSAKMEGKNNPMYGQTHTSEARQKISETHFGKKRSDETCKKLSKLKKGKPVPWLKGKPQSPDHIRKRTEKRLATLRARKLAMEL